MRGIVCILFFLALLVLAGCSAADRAQLSLEQGTRINVDVRTAFFVKSWGLNRALITEAREKWIGEAANAILDRSVDGKLDRNDAMEILAKLNHDIGQDEAVVSESFAYLAFLLIAGERADQYLGQVDTFLESQKPIWMHLSEEGKEVTPELLREIEMWRPLIRDIEKMIPKTLSRQQNNSQ